MKRSIITATRTLGEGTRFLTVGEQYDLQFSAMHGMLNTEKRGIGPGDRVEVCAMGSDPCERLWLEVQAVDGISIIGTFMDDPTWLNAKRGDAVEIELRHVLDTIPLPPQPNTARNWGPAAELEDPTPA